MPLPARLQNELDTVTAMVKIYCNAHHRETGDPLCNQCNELIEYAGKRLAHCPLKSNKPTCGKCTIHCYKKNMQDRVRNVMKYSGPKMLWHHPFLAIKHFWVNMRTPSPSPSTVKHDK